MSAQPAKTLQYTNNLPPFSEEFESGLVGAVISDPDQYYAIAAYVRPEMFFLMRYRVVFEAITRIMTRDGDFDLTVLGEELKAVKGYEEAGGISQLMQLAASAPRGVHTELYGRMVERLHVRRQIQQAAIEMTALAEDEEKAIGDVIAQSQAVFMTATAGGIRRRDATLGEIMVTVTNELDAIVEARRRGELPYTGVATGFVDLDKMLGGMGRGDLLTLAACTGVGKSAWITSLLLNLRQLRVPDERRPGEMRPLRIGGFPMEMSKEQYVQRMLSAHTGINTMKIRQGLVSPFEHHIITGALADLADGNLLIDDSSAPTPEYIHNKCHEWRIQGPLDFVFVDYLQHMSMSPSQVKEGRPRQVGYNAEMMKNLARDLDIPVLQAAQLNRDVEDRADKRPLLSDLKDSSQIEQESDVVMFIYRDALYNTASEHPNLADIIVAKHRHGPTGTISLYFNKPCVRFENGETRRVSLEDL